MPSNLESGSERENVLSVFHNHPDLTLPGEHIDLDELLLDDPSYFIYEFKEKVVQFGGVGEIGFDSYSIESTIEIRRSKEYLKNQGLVLEALVTHRGILDGALFLEECIEIVNAHVVGYMEGIVDEDTDKLVVIRVPEGFDQGELEKSINAVASMIDDLIKLQRKIWIGAQKFEPTEFRKQN